MDPHRLITTETDDGDGILLTPAQRHWYPEYERALELEDSDPEVSIRIYRELVNLESLPEGHRADDPEETENKLAKLKEQAATSLANLLARLGRYDELMDLMVFLRDYFATISKARTAKLVKTIIDLTADGGPAVDVQKQTTMVLEAVEWCVKEKRTFLKQRLQARLAELYFQAGNYKESLNLVGKLIREVKKVDDHLLLVEIHLTETRVHLNLQNLPKAKGAMTSARTAANAVYCPPQLQANIDLLAGILSAREQDFKTSFSYFYEAFEGFNSIERRAQAVKTLKYMLLTKIMSDRVEDVYGIINGKAGLKYAGREVEAMRFVADAYRSRSLHEFNDVYKKYSEELAQDEVVSSHLETLRDGLLQRNLNRVVEPFSRVEISHVAELMDMDQAFVEAKLSEMILDGNLNGILDQGENVLILFEESAGSESSTGPLVEESLAVINELNGVVDRLAVKVQKLLH